MTKKCVRAFVVASEMLAVFEMDSCFSLLLGFQRSTEYRTELLKVECLSFHRLSKNFTIIPVSVIGFVQALNKI